MDLPDDVTQSMIDDAADPVCERCGYPYAPDHIYIYEATQEILCGHCLIAEEESAEYWD